MRACPLLLDAEKLTPIYESQTNYLPRLANQIKLLARIKIKLDNLEKEVSVLDNLTKIYQVPDQNFQVRTSNRYFDDYDLKQSDI